MDKVGEIYVLEEKPGGGVWESGSGKIPKKDTVRALLCHTCNSELGILEKDLDKHDSRLLKYREKYIHRREGAK